MASTFWPNTKMHWFISRFWRAWHTPVIAEDWQIGGYCVLGYGIPALVFGKLTGFIRLAPMREPLHHYLVLPAVLFVLPALAEEVVFRVMLVPHPNEACSHRRLLLESGASLLLFVLWHPVNGCMLSPATRHVLTDWRFLVLATGLGTTCTVVYRCTGSLWPPVLIHWLVVVLWMLIFGGRQAAFAANADEARG